VGEESRVEEVVGVSEFGVGAKGISDGESPLSAVGYGTVMTSGSAVVI